MTVNCRFCNATLKVTFANLGMSPISNNYISTNNAQAMEPFYPLHAYVCSECFLVQLQDFEKAERLFSDEYAYFSSYSASWLNHAKKYARDTIAIEKLNQLSLVIEIASNDGYLLQYFKMENIPVLGIEPTANTAAVAMSERGIPSDVAFFGNDTAKRLSALGYKADVIVANNVLAHVPDINDFVSGLPLVLKHGGIVNIEFPHLLQQILNLQFDTIYHEHFSYLSFTFVRKLFERHSMRIYDVLELKTHGGSLRIFACHAGDTNRLDTERVDEMLTKEADAGLGRIETYENFAKCLIETKCALVDFLISARREGKTVAAYGAPAKGNTLLNYCGIGPDLLPFTVDVSPHKQGKLLPGVRIPILNPSVLSEFRPDYILILPWNLKDEIIKQMSSAKEWGGRFVTAIPTVVVHDDFRG